MGKFWTEDRSHIARRYFHPSARAVCGGFADIADRETFVLHPILQTKMVSDKNSRI